MTSFSAGSTVNVACTMAAGADLPDSFASEFCTILGDEIALNLTAPSHPARVEVALARAGQFTLTAQVKVIRHAGSDGSQDFQLSVRDGTLNPSIAKTLVLPILKLLE